VGLTVLPFGFAPAFLPLKLAITAQKQTRIQIKRLTNARVIGDIYAPLSSLEFRDLRLISAHLLRQGPLRHAELFSMPDEAIDNGAVELIAFRVLAGQVQPQK
jgi:hypothetical protein